MLAGILNVSSKAFLLYGSASGDLLFFRTAFVLVISLLANLHNRKKLSPEISYLKEKSNLMRMLFYSSISGLLVLISTYLFFMALHGGEISIIGPIAQLGFIFSSLLSFFVIKEKFTMNKILGLAVAAASIILFLFI